jgi:hypothetical protein
MARDDADPYAHWNEEADIVRQRENKDAYERGSVTADMTDAEIKQRVYEQMRDDPIGYDHGDYDYE